MDLKSLKKKDLIEEAEKLEIEVLDSWKKSDIIEAIEAKLEEPEKPEEEAEEPEVFSATEEPEKEEIKPSFVVKNNTKRKRNVCEFLLSPGEEKELSEKQFNSAKVQHSLKNKRLLKV